MKNLFKGFLGLLLFCTLFNSLSLSPDAAAKKRTRIHFICLDGNNDSILLESNGHFGMVDSGEDGDHPNGYDYRYPLRPGIDASGGHEGEVIQYLKKAGVKKLDFYIGTHSHSDHISSGDEILNAFPTDRLYLNDYSDVYISSPDHLWDNQYCHDTLMDAAQKGGTKIIQDFSKKSNRSFYMGRMKVEILNYQRAKGKDGQILPRPDDNFNSLGVKVTVDTLSAFLAGDINNYFPDYDEDRLAGEIGVVNLLKLGHHGIGDSNTLGFLKALYPDYAVATGSVTDMPQSVRSTLSRLKCTLYSTNNQPGGSAVIADMTNGVTMKMLAPGKLSLKSKKVNRKNRLVFYTFGNRRYNQKDSWLYYNQNFYYIDGSGCVSKNCWKKTGQYFYYLGQDGIMLTDAARIRGIPYSFDYTGRLSDGGWTRGSSSWSYALANGRALTGRRRIGGKYYIFNSSGAMMTGMVNYRKKTYYLKSDGSMAVNAWIRLGNVKYYAGKNGALLKNTRKKIKGRVFQFDRRGMSARMK